jgi:transcriptional regulator with XRE-family HTH domain
MVKNYLEEVKETLAAVEQIRQNKNLSRRQISDRLGIPFNTFRAWFHQRGAKTPSKPLFLKLRAFIEVNKRSTEKRQELWDKIREWWRTQHKYSSLKELAEELGWTADDLSSCLQNKSVPPRIVVEGLANILQLQTPPDKLIIEAKRRLNRLKLFLILLEEEIAWFRDSPSDVREIYRSELDQFDTGYLSSLITMLFAEDKFLRWLELTNNRFNFFKNKGSLR